MFAIIAAAGYGTRFGNIKKQFLKINNKFILDICVEKFIKCGILNIVIATAKEDMKTAAQILTKFKRYIKIVEGGMSRQETVKKAFLKYYKNYNKNDLVLVHDAVRPFFDIDKLKKLISIAKIKKAAILACPVVDTVKHVEKNEIIGTLNRNKIYLAQTPQAFTIELYKKAIDLSQNQNVKYTDDSELIEQLKHPVEIVTSYRDNFKITTKQDLKYISFLMQKEL